MTYCLSLHCREGIAFLSDSRTTAGIDNVTTHSKMQIYEREGERVVCVLSSGNLSVTQSIGKLIQADLAQCEAGASIESIWTCASLYEVVRYVGEKVRAVRKLDAEWLRQSGLEFNVNLIVGGQIHGQQPEIYHVYAEGNPVLGCGQAPFLQIGELKYGKPILDRGFTFETPLAEAVRLGILSLDATAKSNLSVGPPFEVFAYRRDSLSARDHVVLDEHDPWLRTICQKWQVGLVELVRGMPPLEFK